MRSRSVWSKCSSCHHEGYAKKGDKCDWCDNGTMRQLERADASGNLMLTITRVRGGMKIIKNVIISFALACSGFLFLGSCLLMLREGPSMAAFLIAWASGGCILIYLPDIEEVIDDLCRNNIRLAVACIALLGPLVASAFFFFWLAGKIIALSQFIIVYLPWYVRVYGVIAGLRAFLYLLSVRPAISAVYDYYIGIGLSDEQSRKNARGAYVSQLVSFWEGRP